MFQWNCRTSTLITTQYTWGGGIRQLRHEILHRGIRKEMRDTSYNAQRGRLSGSVRVYGGAWRLLEIHADGGFHEFRTFRKKPTIYVPMKTGDA